MPNLPTVQQYQATDPYEVVHDNIPIQGLILNDSLINNAVDSATTILQTAQGTAGDLNGRLNVSLNSDGTLKAGAVNNTLHNMDYHTDGTTYVRMALTERNKLATITSGATAITCSIDTTGGTINVSNGSITIGQSSTIQWAVVGGKICPQAVFAPRGHFYAVVPYTTDHLNFKTTSIGQPYISGTLRVYINGVRIPESPNSVYVPTNITSTLTWVQLSVTEVSSAAGTFALNTAITTHELITIDFDFAQG